MAIVKLSSSGKAVLFIDDSGNVFATSLSWLKNFLNGLSDKKFVLLTRMPEKVIEGKFMVSPLYTQGVRVNLKDSFSKQAVEERSQASNYVDKEVL